MQTYQDLMQVLDRGNDQELLGYIRKAINEHQSSKPYKMAVIANEYFCRRNITIVEYQKLLYTVTGQAVEDNYSANYKMRSNFLFFFITQLKQYLLANGATWNNDGTEKRLGKDFTNRLKEAGKEAMIGGVSFGFMNYDHLEVFKIQEFVPFYDEENGALMAGVRFWQIDAAKPLRATLYTIDGITECIWRGEEAEIIVPLHAYTQRISQSVADGTIIYDGDNYPTFPIVPCYGINRQSELEGRREKIDAYDLIESGFANTVDDASLIYWTIQGAGGMRDMDLAKFVERVKTVHAASVGDGQSAESHTVDPPYSGRDALLTRLRDELYEDFMAFDVGKVASGSTVTAQIKAAYTPLSLKADDFEENIIEFCHGLLAVLGIDDEPTFNRSEITNQAEQISMVLQSAQYLDEEYVTRKLLTILGDIDMVEAVLARKAAEDVERVNLARQIAAGKGAEQNTNEPEEPEEPENMGGEGNE